MKRTLIIFIALAVGLALIAVAVSLFQGRSNTNTNTGVNETPPAADTQTNTSTVTPTVTNAQDNALARARSFAEIYGSWSTDSLDRFTAGLSGWLTSRFAESVAAPTPLSGNVTSISTQALSTKINQLTESKSATVVVTTRRTQTRSNEPSATYYENLTVNLVYQEPVWLVDNAAWSASIVQPGGSGA